jgi:hypothetical protein
MPRPLQRVHLESGLKLNLNSLVRGGIIKPGAITGPVGIAWRDDTDWPAFADTVRVVRGGAAGWPAEFDLVCRWYAPHLERLYEDAKTREADLVQLAQIASTYPNRERFLTELTLDPPAASGGEAGVPLCLMRIT